MCQRICFIFAYIDAYVRTHIYVGASYSAVIQFQQRYCMYICSYIARRQWCIADQLYLFSFFYCNPYFPFKYRTSMAIQEIYRYVYSYVCSNLCMYVASLIQFRLFCYVHYFLYVDGYHYQSGRISGRESVTSFGMCTYMCMNNIYICTQLHKMHSYG